MNNPEPPQLSAAARALLARRAGVRPDAGPRRGAAGDVAPLATTQLSQWLASQVSLVDAEGSLPKVLHLEGRLDRGALGKALTEIVRRHGALRTIFSVRQGEPVQRVTPPREVELPAVDLRDLPAEDRTQTGRVLLEKDARRRFDLTRDLLMRPILVQLEDQAFELQVTFQHVAFDGWSNGVFLRELGALYSAYAEGKQSPLPEPELQYADFAVWERSREATASFDADRAYWVKEISGSTSALGLLTDRARTRQRSAARASVTATIEAPLTQRLAQLAMDEGTTLFAVTFAAFQVLVGRRTGCLDFVLGAVSANRTRRETEELIGSFITVLPFRAQLADSPSFRTFLRRTAEAQSRGFAHQAFAFQRLMPELRPGGDPGIDPLYDVMFNYRNMPVALPVMLGLEVSNFRAPHLATSYDLHLNLTPADGVVRLELEYNPDLIHQESATRWLAGYGALLEAVASDPGAATLELPVMPRSERSFLLEEWSGAPNSAPEPSSILALFERSIATRPHAVAVQDGDRSVSYRELGERARRCAVHLQSLGVRPGTGVAVGAERSIEVVAAALAIFSLGAIYIPIDPATPRPRLAGMLERAGVTHLLASDRGASLLSGCAERIIRFAEMEARATDGFVAPDTIGLDDPAYIIFTSGSTGVPKGVVISHGALGQYVQGSARILDVKPGDRMLHFHELTFDTSIEEIFVPLGAGATVVVRPESMIDTPVIFARDCRALRLTHVVLPTGFWNEVIAFPWPQGMDLGDEMYTLAIGGEASTPDAIAHFFTLVNERIRLFNGYGPTETTVAVTWAQLHRGEEFPGEVPIGRPYPGAIARVVDSRGQPVPIGTPGELWIGGGSLARGYLGEPELTAERFVGDPIAPAPDRRFYRSGDRVRWRNDGQIGYLGRIDTQLKVRGYRVDPADVEQALRSGPGVRQVAVLLHPTGRDRLIAFVVPEGDGFDPMAVREAATLALPHYMVPAEIVQLSRLPLSSTGKLDRAALAAMVPASAEPAGGQLTTATERAVARIWEEVLGVTGIGPDDRFLDLGGHSLLAMRVAHRVSEDLGIALTIRSLLGHPTVAMLARELDRMAALVAEAPHH